MGQRAVVNLASALGPPPHHGSFGYDWQVLLGSQDSYKRGAAQRPWLLLAGPHPEACWGLPGD